MNVVKTLPSVNRLDTKTCPTYDSFRSTGKESEMVTKKLIAIAITIGAGILLGLLMLLAGSC